MSGLLVGFLSVFNGVLLLVGFREFGDEPVAVAHELLIKDLGLLLVRFRYQELVQKLEEAVAVIPDLALDAEAVLSDDSHFVVVGLGLFQFFYLRDVPP